jgi:hypothetical protein
VCDLRQHALEAIGDRAPRKLLRPLARGSRGACAHTVVVERDQGAGDRRRIADGDHVAAGAREFRKAWKVRGDDRYSLRHRLENRVRQPLPLRSKAG